MKYIGIIGHEATKFTPEQEKQAREIIKDIIADDCVVVSGGCHLGGVDIWAEEEALNSGRDLVVFCPKERSWHGGYKDRNLRIAALSDEVHVILVPDYPPGYQGVQFDMCYHCHTTSHVKSGACWTAKEARKLGKKTFYHIIGANVPDSNNVIGDKEGKK